MFYSIKNSENDVLNDNNIYLTEKITIDELFEIIKNTTYICGTPYITGKGFTRRITFPPIDKYTIQIIITNKTITVTKTYSGICGPNKEKSEKAVANGFINANIKDGIDLNQIIRTISEKIFKQLNEKGLTKA